MGNITIGILNEFSNKEKSYIKACEDLSIDYKHVDIISADWIKNIKESKCDAFLVRPAGDSEVWKGMYNERLYYLVHFLKKKIYPSYDEIVFYENKKMQSYWLELNNIPHPKTWVFYKKQEALDFVNNHKEWPMVFKPNVGSVGMGVKILKKPSQAKKLINRIFTKYRFYNRGYTKWQKTEKGFIFPKMDDKQYNFITFHQFIDVKYEWRTLRVGNSYFGHQKLKKGDFHSGSGLVGWVKPPLDLMNFAHEINEKGNFRSMNLDIFEDTDGKYWVNELQTVWGGELISQMNIDGKPYRFVYNNGNWDLEEGNFNQNKSCNLRILDFIEQLNNEKA